MKIHSGGVYLINGTKLIPDTADADALLAKEGISTSKERSRRGTIAWSILHNHNESGDEEKLRIHFDKMTSHDITYVGIIQTARASGLERFPIPYVLTNCHNSLCAVGGTINEDDHMFGLSAAKKYGGIYVPPHQAVIHQFAREMLAECGGMILGSDSHTRYGALGTMAVGEGGGELVKQLLGQTWDVDMPGVVAVYLTGEPMPGVGPQDVALAIIGAVFEKGYVKNRVMEFVGPGVKNLSADFRIGVDVMTTETTCLSSIWQTDEKVKEFYEIHGRGAAYRELAPADAAYYDRCIEVDLGSIRPMIAMPFHPSNVYPIEEVQQNLEDVLDEVEKRAKVSFGDTGHHRRLRRRRFREYLRGGGYPEGSQHRSGRIYAERLSGIHACLYGAGEERKVCRPDRGRCRGEDRVLRTLLRRGRHPGEQCIFHPAFDEEFPEPGRLEGTERADRVGRDRVGRADGRAFHRCHCREQGVPDGGHAGGRGILASEVLL